MSKPQNQADQSMIKRVDNDFPISWVKTLPEGGRVFYSSLGTIRIFSTSRRLRHFLDGFNTRSAISKQTQLLPAPCSCPLQLLSPGNPGSERCHRKIAGQLSFQTSSGSPAIGLGEQPYKTGA